MRQSAGDGAVDLVGTLLGEICNMEKGINTLVSKLQQLMSAKGKKKASAHEVLYSELWRLSSCSAPAAPASSAPCARMTGDASIPDCQSVSRLFTATIFACTLGIAVAAISVPMLLIQLTLAACAAIIVRLPRR